MQTDSPGSGEKSQSDGRHTAANAAAPGPARIGRGKGFSMYDFKRTQSKLAGQFTRTEHTPEYSIIKCVGTVWADALTADEAEHIKRFYQYPASAPHEIIPPSGKAGDNGYIKIYA